MTELREKSDLHHAYLRRDFVTRNAVTEVVRQYSKGTLDRAGASMLMFELGLDLPAVTRMLAGDGGGCQAVQR